MIRFLVTMSAFLMALAVGLGAFGAHGLANVLSAKALANWQTAVDYHFIHALAGLVLSLLAWRWQDQAGRVLPWIVMMLLLGILLFSGSLYLWALTEIKWLVFLTPLGGLVWLVAWTLLAYQAWFRFKY
ncbi:membrane protein [Thiomicrospira aerophila AL3]|uniref:Membrane protein n=1 Tax=Thiomicrospira aerophila AL3 TaxID=717772 RepID=W0DWX2_9GAMM|nr:DUF423 domain-containing protein [Thiomicrospira aerophila]AHF01366.1 membrane protein [Thiomicrospira aerophila AL3]